MGVGAFMFLRFAVLTLLGFVLLAIVFRGRFRRSWPKREDLPRFIACGLIGHAAHVGIVTYGMNLSTAFSSSLVLTSGPLFTLIILVLLGSERLRPRQIAGGFSRAGGGDLLLLLAAALFSLYTVLARPIAERYGALIVLAYTLLFSAPLILAFTFSSFLELRFRD